MRNDGNVGTSFVGLLTLLFIGLKLSKCIDWSWWWVISPFFILLAIVGLILMIGLAAQSVSNLKTNRQISKIIKKDVWPLKADDRVSVIVKQAVTVGIVNEIKEDSINVNTRAGDFDIIKDHVFDSELVSVWHSANRPFVISELSKIGIKVKDKLL